jgi:DNA adenine methylase
MPTPKREEPLQIDMDFTEALERFAGVNTRELEEEPAPYGKAAPFVKWAGGKRSIIEELAVNVPSQFNDYYEAFIGGGALFYHLQDRINTAYLSDINFELVITYNVIKNNVEELITLLKAHQEKHSEEYYYKVRSQNFLQDPIKIAARFLYLNKTCYNGLYRVNRKGEFNTPMGSYKNPDVVQEKNLKLCQTALQIANINYWQFDQITPKEGDFVYFDPPYHPISDTSFTSYTKLDFAEPDQVRLRDFALALHKRGVKVMLSNSNAKLIRTLYKDKPFIIRSVHAPRNINCKPSERNNVEELLITTYG